LFFIVSGEQRITKQMFGLHLSSCSRCRVISKNARATRGHPQDIAYNQKSYVIRLKTDNCQYATQLIVENLENNLF